jgi:hypothetical protein
MFLQWRKEDGLLMTLTLENPSDGESLVMSIWQEKRGLVFTCFETSSNFPTTLFFSVIRRFVDCGIVDLLSCFEF